MDLIRDFSADFVHVVARFSSRFLSSKVIDDL